MHSLFELLVVGSRRVIAFAPLYAALFLVQILRLELLEQKAVTFIICFLLWVVLCWVSVNNLGTLAHLVPVAILGWITLQGTLPGVADSLRNLAVIGEERLADGVREIAVQAPQVVACDEETVAQGQVYVALNTATNQLEPRLWYSVRGERIECWDRAGVHPQNGTPLHAVNGDIATLIARQTAPGRTNAPPANRTRTPYEPVIEVAPRQRTYQPVIIVNSH